MAGSSACALYGDAVCTEWVDDRRDCTPQRVVGSSQLKAAPTAPAAAPNPQGALKCVVDFDDEMAQLAESVERANPETRPERADQFGR
ncbi:hypothetical protein GR157_35535 [Burkholderia sp. 4701]|nr:hypothetical protein [Burkholderia sp. 4701]MXN87245.1 hypothetical protein [Burkholderia sp. 4812]